MNYALSILLQDRLAEEAVHESFLKAFEGLAELKEIEKIKSWMWSILRNECFQVLRKHSSKKEILESSTRKEESDASLLDQTASEDPSAEALLIENSSEKQLSQAWEMLTGVQREVLKLRMESELSLEEIAELLKLPLSTVKSHIHRAKQILMKELSGAKT